MTLNDSMYFEALLQRIASGETTPEQALHETRARRADWEAVGDFAKVDLRRAERTGTPEIIYAPGKTTEQIIAIASRMRVAGLRNVLVTRLEGEAGAALRAAFPDCAYHPLSRVAVIDPVDVPVQPGFVAVVTAGTSDLAVAEEAELVCAVLGTSTERVADIGVACLERTLDAVPRLRAAAAIICVAGMEAALASVLAGLVSAPVIAVPVSNGYGVNAGGYNALLSVLGSCVPGVLAVNIDNGVGAAVAAHRILAAAQRGAR